MRVADLTLADTAAVIAEGDGVVTVQGMTISVPSGTVTLTLTLTELLADQLPVELHPNLFPAQPDRFELIGEPLPQPDAAVFARGTMTRFASFADLLLFRAYEHACGQVTRPLWDTEGEPGFVLLSSRWNPWGIGR